MRSDGLCSLFNYNLPKITYFWVTDEIKTWEVVYLVATDLPTKAKIGKYYGFGFNESLQDSIS